jgi:hypothetical protein
VGCSGPVGRIFRTTNAHHADLGGIRVGTSGRCADARDASGAASSGSAGAATSAFGFDVRIDSRSRDIEATNTAGEKGDVSCTGSATAATDDVDRIAAHNFSKASVAAGHGSGPGTDRAA